MSRRPRAAKGEDSLAGPSIRVVSNRTGILPDTLRMWERRYGFPKPSRRAGGSRVYSEDDVARLHLVSRALASGFRPGEVVTLSQAELTKLVEASGSASPSRLVARAPPPVAAAATTPSIEGVIDALCGEDLVAVRSLVRAAALAMGPRGFVISFAHPLLVRVGELWAEGRLDVRHEHLASACLTSQLHLLLGALEDGDRSPVVLLATLPSEPHLLGIDMVAVVLAASFAAPRVLGADTPPSQIVEAARAMHPDVVGLSISPAADGRVAARAVKEVADALPQEIDLWLGGGGARAIAQAAPRATIVATWPELDAAIAAKRAV